ncbi:MAG: bifunctional ADP-heptose synthase [Desulfovibrionaceae bacterium]|nr:bifunctional ADP-heptose synthase [Desulfovibrionaceae bacterium]
MNEPLPRPEELLSRLSCLEGAKVLIIGDLILDEYLLGDAGRISPEAPVPIVLVEEERFMPGGAGNVARNIRSLGGQPHLISACGDGHNSALLRQILNNNSLAADLVPLPGRPATTKTRIMARGQQVVRVDREDASSIPKEASRKILKILSGIWNEFPVLVLSDYDKGVINREFMEGLRELRLENPRKNKVLVDPKPRNFPLYQGLDLLTPNASETAAAAGMPAHTQAEILAAGRTIFARNNCEALLSTLGSNGLALFQGPDDVLHIPTVAQKVFDVSGAGDTVIATLALALAGGLNLLEASMLANFAAGNVVAEVGAATTTLPQIAQAIQTLGRLPLERWL